MNAPAGRSYIIYSRDRVTAGELEQRRHVLFTMLTVLDYRYDPSRGPALITALRAWLHGWVGIGRIVAGLTR